MNIWRIWGLPYDWENHPAPAIFLLGSLRSGRIEVTVAGLQGVRDDVLGKSKGLMTGDETLQISWDYDVLISVMI